MWRYETVSSHFVCIATWWTCTVAFISFYDSLVVVFHSAFCSSVMADHSWKLGDFGSDLDDDDADEDEDDDEGVEEDDEGVEDDDEGVENDDEDDARTRVIKETRED